MASWKVELNGSSDGGGVYCSGSLTTVCTSADGKFKFKAPNSGADKYTITYTDDNSKTTTKEYTVNAGDCINCDCNKINFTATAVQKEGGNVKLGTFDVTSDYCESTYPVTASDVAGGIATGTQVKNGNEVWGNVPENESGEKTITFNLSINGNPCQKTTTQGAGCSCGNLTLTPSQTSFPNTGYNGEVASYSLNNNCDYSKVGIQGDTSVFSLDTSSHKVTASVGANPSYTEPRNFSYTLTYNNSPCTGKGQTISQGASPVPCQGCNETHLTMYTYSVSESGYDGRIGEYSVGSGCDSSKVGLDSSSNREFSLDHGYVLAHIEPTSVDREYYIKLSYDGEGCPSCTATVSQTVTPVWPDCCVIALGENYIKEGTSVPGTCAYYKCTGTAEPSSAYATFDDGTPEWLTGLEINPDPGCGPTSDYDGRIRGNAAPNNSGAPRYATIHIVTTCGELEPVTSRQDG